MSTDTQTVTVRVQVVDMQPFTLDLQVPTYLPARDLTQRIARDAGLDAYWGDGRRRLYWLRARGRLVDESESLSELGVIDGELVYLLPEPPAGSGVLERPPAYPENQGYRGTGIVPLVTNIVSALLWTVGWGVAMSMESSIWVIGLPALGLGLLTTGFSRHAWSAERANRYRIPLTSVAVALLFTLLAITLARVLSATGPEYGLAQGSAAALFVLVGALIGWLAWWGAVEPLPVAVVETAPAETSVAVVPCGICGEDVGPEYRVECGYRCGRFFHTGCQTHRLAVYSGADDQCGLCGAQIS